MGATEVRTIGILTGGGDVPGLNPCIKQLVVRAAELGIRAVGIRRGWGGLLAYDPADPATVDDCIVALDAGTVRTIDRTGGTILHTSRTNPSAVSYHDAPEFLRDAFTDEGGKVDFTAHALANLDHLGIDVLAPIGGDDTLSFAARLHREGFPVVAIPKTMDNDVVGTDYCIGFSTAITRSVDHIRSLRTSAGSHERIAVVELFGRYCGQTSLITGYLAGVDRVILSEVPFDVERLAGMLTGDRAANPSRYAMMTISEGATMVDGDMVQRGEADAFGHRKLGGIGEVTSEAIKELTGVGVIFQPLLYLMRSGSPDSLDLMVAMNYANLAAELISRGRTGVMTALSGGRYTALDLGELKGGAKKVDVEALYDVENYRPSIRDPAGVPMFLY